MEGYLIWSIEHNAWWKSSSRGYTRDIGMAGFYQPEEAEKICRDANRSMSTPPMEAMVPVSVSHVDVECREENKREPDPEEKR